MDALAQGRSARAGLACGGTGGHEEGQQVFVGGVHQCRVRGAGAVVEQRRPVAGRGFVQKPVSEGRALGRGRPVHVHAPAAEHPLQVVRDAAAAHHQHALGRQRRQRLAQCEQLGRRPARGPGQGQHGDVGLGEQVAQRRPDAVVQPALRQHMGRQAGTLQQGLHAGGQRRGAGGVVAQGVQTRVETAEVVDGFVLGGGQQHGLARQAVGADGDDGFGAAKARGQRRAQALHEGTGLARLQRRHGRTVADEQGRQRRRGVRGGVHGAIEAPPSLRRLQAPCTAGSRLSSTVMA